MKVSSLTSVSLLQMMLLGPQINYMPDKSHDVIVIIINAQGQIVQIHLIRKNV